MIEGMEMKKILMITGSYPPDVCGVGDYTERLIKNLKKIIDIDIFHYNDWKLKKFFLLKKEIFKKNHEIYHFQYPTMGYSWSLLPQIFCLLYGKKIILTLHEYSKRTFKAKLATYLFFLSKVFIIFTTDEERVAALKWAPWLKNRSTVIQIGSNIEFLKEKKNKDYDFGYFGLLLPNKGIEDYLKFLESYGFGKKNYLMGKIVKGFETYAIDIKEKFKNIDIEFKIGYDDDEVAEVLASTKCMCLLYPDGVSFRRGSLLASLGNGCEIISKKSQKKNIELEKICYFIENMDELLVEETLSYDFKKNKKNVRDSILNEFSWERIAQLHKELYYKM